jgi:hypothetical protein
MANLEDAIGYICQNYPYEDELSNARLTKMIYLADWHALINDHPKITDINWYFDNYGPFVWDIKNCAEGSNNFFVDNTRNYYGSSKSVIRLTNDDFRPVLRDYEKSAFDHAMETTKSMPWDRFIRLIYSTYPVATSSKYSFLNLEAKAKAYKAVTR